MARTRASVRAKFSGAKSSKARCSVPAPTTSSGSKSSSKTSSHGGGNPVCPRETPKWQKPITNFFIGHEPKRADDDDQQPGSSKHMTKKRRVNRIEDSDDEPGETADEVEDSQTEDVDPGNEDLDSSIDRPTNKELDETLELEPLTGENSHTIDEYYGEGKGTGKTNGKNKENVSSNVKRTSSKRSLDDDSEVSSKKVKV